MQFDFDILIVLLSIKKKSQAEGFACDFLFYTNKQEYICLYNVFIYEGLYAKELRIGGRIMEDSDIVKLFLERSESAISELDEKYRGYCHNIAVNILSVESDAEECVSDTYYKAWESIPPQKPEKLGAWLGRVTRNMALDMWRKNHRKKRYAGIEEIFDELGDCIPSNDNVESAIDGRMLTETLNSWLGSLTRGDRILFMRRYWYGERVNKLAGEYGTSDKKLAKKLYRLRQRLKVALEKEGYLL